MDFMQIMLLVLVVIVTVVLNLALAYSQFKILAVTFSPEHAAQPETKRLQGLARALTMAVGLLFLGLSFLGRLDAVKSWLDAFYFLLLIFYMISCGVLMMQIQKALLRLKEARGWHYQTGSTVVVDTAASRERGLAAPPIRWAWLLWLVTFAPLLLRFLNDTSSSLPGFTLVVFPLVLVIIPLSYPAVLRLRVRAASSDSKLNQAYARRAERIYGLSYLATELIIVLVSLAIAIGLLYFPAASNLILLTMPILIALLLTVSYLAERKLKEAGEELLKDPTVQFQETRQPYKWGFYHDPLDPRVFVPKRIAGMGVTINIGNRKGKVIAGLTMGFVVLLLLGGFMLGFLSFAFELEADRLQIESPLYGWEIQADEIESIALTETQLDGRRTNGYGGQNKAYGFFTLNEYGPVRLYIHTAVKEHIDIKLKDESARDWVILNLETAEETAAFYAELQAWLASAAP
ncbi:MAG: hypothetical protein EOM03_12850 [Clostridia bacterium]|nr:hypothetical protein [Clostridia bacterium]